MTFTEITNAWDYAEANINKLPLSRRTFLRHKALAEEIFNVNIKTW